MQTLLTEKQKAELIQTFDNLPSNDYLSALLSREEIEKFKIHKKYFLTLKQALSNYFNGKLLLEGMEEIIFESPVAQELFELRLFEYIDLYNMIFLGWDDILKTFKGTVLPGKSPGDVFTYILENEARQNFKDNKKLLDAQTLYRAWNVYKKCLNPNSENRQQELKKLEQLISRLKRQSKKLRGETNIEEHQIFVGLCVEACLKSKNKQVKNKAIGYLAAKNDRLDTITRQLRRQNFKVSSTVYIT
jgi:hypothetical protein